MQVSDPGKEDFSPKLVFGQRNKLTAEGPFLSLLMEFKKELSLSNELFIVGYSFRDNHINELVKHWLNGSGKRKIKIFNGNSSLSYKLPVNPHRTNPFIEERIEKTMMTAEDAFRTLL